MLSSLRPKSVYDVLALISCTGLLAGGTAYAAATITGADVVNESLTTSDIKANSLYGGDIANDSISGYDVKESTLNLKPTVTAVAPALSQTSDACGTNPPATGRFCGVLPSAYWFNYGNGFQEAGFFKDALGLVHLQGSISGSSGNGTIFVLPAGYRPAKTRLFRVYDNNSPSTSGYVKVYPDGRVTYRDGDSTISTYLSLDGISFRL
jgi:hypothetical protein